MQAYKIRILNPELSRQIQIKAFELGYDWPNNRMEPYVFQIKYLYLSDTGNISHGLTEPFFINFRSPEISYQDFLQLDTIQPTQTTEIMSEIKLKCKTAPTRAKNITVDREYTGIFIDGDDTQVDSIRNAEFFQCVNNSGVEAKYKISLFEPIVPPTPPKIALEDLVLNVTNDVVNFTWNSRVISVCTRGTSYLSHQDVNSSCGIQAINNIDGLFDRISADINLYIITLSAIIQDFDESQLRAKVFKAILLAKVQSLVCAICLFSTREEKTLICELLEELVAETQGASCGDIINPNSGNLIRAWLIKKL